MKTRTTDKILKEVEVETENRSSSERGKETGERATKNEGEGNIKKGQSGTQERKKKRAKIFSKHQ